MAALFGPEVNKALVYFYATRKQKGQFAQLLKLYDDNTADIYVLSSNKNLPRVPLCANKYPFDHCWMWPSSLVP